MLNKVHIFADDTTRVVLTGAESGDYINANFINMEIPGSGIINRYIGTQGEDTLFCLCMRYLNFRSN